MFNCRRLYIPYTSPLFHLSTLILKRCQHYITEIQGELSQVLPPNSSCKNENATFLLWLRLADTVSVWLSLSVCLVF